MGIAAVLAPLLVGLGVAEEREEGTLQLLIITQLSTFQILWGKVGSRLLILASFILGSLPVLALIATFGGVGIGEVLNVTVNTLLVCVVLGTVGGVAAMFSGGGAAALGAALLWAVVSWGILPFLYFGFSHHPSPCSREAPGVLRPSSPTCLLSCLSHDWSRRCSRLSPAGRLRTLTHR
jgi:ABC-type transport system involved in multi-copper enzyme maturation permease subunit